MDIFCGNISILYQPFCQTWMSQEVSKWLVNGLFHLLLIGVYWGYNPLTNHLLTSWDIRGGFRNPLDFLRAPDRPAGCDFPTNFSLLLGEVFEPRRWARTVPCLWRGKKNIWAVTKTLVNCCIEGMILPSYMGIVISHYKDPGSLLNNQYI